MLDSNESGMKRSCEEDQQYDGDQPTKAAKVENDEESSDVNSSNNVPIAVEESQPVISEEIDEKVIEEKLLDIADSGTESESVLLDEAALLEEVKEEKPVVLSDEHKEAEIPSPVVIGPQIPEAKSHNGHLEFDDDDWTPKVTPLDDTTSKEPYSLEPTDPFEMEVQSSPEEEDPQPAEDPSLTQPCAYERDYFQSCSVTEIGRCSWDRAVKQNYVRGCLWSPDGTCVLGAVHNDGMHVFELPSDMYASEEIGGDRPVHLLDSAVHVRETTMVYDYKWYPGMHSSMPETSVWIASRQHEPIQMWDAYTGKLRCSYKGYNAVDEVEAALSLAWSADCSYIYGGYKKSIKLFDVKSPGKEISSFPTKVTASCMTICAPVPNLLIFGSWSRSITALDTNSHQTITVGNNSRECSHNAGVTWLKFIPRTNLFVSGGRKDPKLMMWDIRNLVKPYHILNRTCDTNQRIYFDSSPCGEWLISGDTDGIVRAWNLLETDMASKSYRQYNFPLHRDCCNGVSFHPSKPIVATASGQFHPSSDVVAPEPESSKPLEPENSLTLWWVGKTVFSDE